MRTQIAMYLALLFPLVGWCQSTTEAETAIRRIVNTGLIEGHDQKLIGELGDQAAVIVTKVVAEKKLSPSDIDRILIVLNSAFGNMSPGPAQEPKTTLFVLQTLELSTNDGQLLRKIAQTKQYVKESFIKSQKSRVVGSS